MAARKKQARSKRTPRRPKAPARRAARGHRLSPDVRPRSVDLELEVDPERSRVFRGRVVHELELDRSCTTLELHVSELRVSGAVVEAGGRRLRGELVEHPERETLEIRLPERIGVGSARLSLRFSGRLRDDLRGLYYARGARHAYAFTQLEATDARRFFPCFDEPVMKARFQLSVTTAAAHTVLSNSKIKRTERLSDGRKTVHFGRTPPLSTYLLALAVGALEGSRTVRCGETPIRVWHVPGKRALTAFALEAGRECLARLERYFGLPYPYEKLDLVAVPDFEAGAMENAGAVFFRETLLLSDPRTLTHQERKRVAEVVCHELAHMWYGDLVTMAWWDDLWLNEAFATWMAFQVVDDWKPEWRMWNDFQHYRSAALELDALDNTHPIYVEVASPAEATENFDLITYEKGASVVRMIERYLGPRAFRAGVRRYIRRHREGNTVAADLWQALSEASGQDVAPVVRAWIEREGFPVLSTKRQQRGRRTRLALRQERFHGAPARTRARAERRECERTRWPIPVVARVGTPQSRRTRLVRGLVERQRQALDLGPGEPRFVYANADEGSFFRPLHEAGELQRLAAHLGELEAVERMGLLGHQWALVRAGLAGIDGYLSLVDAAGDEEDPDVLLTLHGPLGFLDHQVAAQAGGDAPQQLRGRLIERFAPALESLGLRGRRSGGLEARLRRAALFGIVGGIAEWEPAVAEAARQCDAYLLDRRAVDPNLVDPVVQLAARHGDSGLFARLHQSVEGAETPQDRRRLLLALAEFRAPRLVDRALGLTLSGEVPTQDVAILLARLLANPGANLRAWPFLKRNWEALHRRMPPMLVTRVIDATPALRTPAHRREVAAFFKTHPVPTGQRAVRQALERFDRNRELRRRAAPGLRAWLRT
ncbi:MAG: M1 family metallopeptidase [Myxococcota bacterium]